MDLGFADLTGCRTLLFGVCVCDTDLFLDFLVNK